MKNDGDAAATATTIVHVNPATAFEIFTANIGTWWRPGSHYWNDAERAVRIELEPGVGGRFREIYDESNDEAFEIGRVTVWEPASRLTLTWRETDWAPDETTTVDVVFEPIEAGTRVTLTHSGWGTIGREGEGKGYTDGWVELVDWFADEVDSADRRVRNAQ
jgi:Activator of Hsp90 ATPase homolog 1-like protein